MRGFGSRQHPIDVSGVQCWRRQAFFAWVSICFTRLGRTCIGSDQTTAQCSKHHVAGFLQNPMSSFEGKPLSYCLGSFPKKPFMARALRQRVYEIELQAKYPKASGEVSGREQTCFTRNSPTLDSNGSANPAHFNAEPLRPKCLKLAWMLTVDD